MSSSFMCGALAFLFILPFSLRALSSRLVRAPSAAVLLAMDHGCAHTLGCELRLRSETNNFRNRNFTVRNILFSVT